MRSLDGTDGSRGALPPPGGVAFRRRRRHLGAATLVVVAAAAVALLAAGGAAARTEPQPPFVVGEFLPAAEESIQARWYPDSGVTVEFTEVPDVPATVGRSAAVVVSQRVLFRPGGDDVGDSVDTAGIELTVGSLVPDLMGLSRAGADSRLAALGLSLGSFAGSDSAVAARVVRQAPSAGIPAAFDSIVYVLFQLAPTPTITPTPTSTTSPTPTRSRSPTPTPTRSARRTPSPTASTTSSPTASPEAIVAPTASPPVERGAVATGLRPPSDPALRQPRHVLTSLLLALVLVLLIGFPAQVFESTLETNYDRVVGPFRRLPRLRLPDLSVPPWLTLTGFVVLAVGLNTLVDPNFGRRWTVTFLDAVGLLVAIPLIVLAFEVPTELVSRRHRRPHATLRVLPVALVLAVAFAVMSRLGSFQPGYIYGLIIGYGVVQARRLSAAERASSVLVGSAAIATVTVICWAVWAPVDQTFGASGHPFALQLVDSILATTVVVGVQALAFQLLPLTFLDGHEVTTWSRVCWAAVYVFVLFALILVTFAPRTRNVGVDPQVVVMIVLFAAFGVFSAAFWAYFRFVPGEAPGTRSR
jgi:hypothetical protein